jgi:tetratricopeptide (TPR) repeat protein
MKFWKRISSRLRRPAHLGRQCFFMVFVTGGSICAPAKDASTTAIMLFDGTQGAAYVQITGMTLNGKTEVRICDGASKFGKNVYDSLSRARFNGATSLQRGADGVLTLTVNAKSLCVVPSNLKFDKKPELTPAEAAEQAVVQGAPISSSRLSPGMPAFKPGVQLVFVSAPDIELADFLRAQRANNVQDWQAFLVRYPSSTRLLDAQSAMAALHQQAAETAFGQYQKSRDARKQDIAMLKQASMEAKAANRASAGYNPAIKLVDNITRELDNLLEADRARLQVFQRALQDHGSGYSQLAAATGHLEQLLEVRSDYAPLLNLRQQVAAEEQRVEVTVANAESLTASARYDDGVRSLGPYSSFASEIPRVDAVVNAAYKYHLGNAQKLAAQQDWEQAVAEFRKAAAIRPDSKEAEATLNNAKIQLSAKRDQQEANLAFLQSKDYASKNQFVEAYNVLADLPDKPRALVTSQLSALTRNYVSAATRRGQKLQEVHIPIKGRADEDAVREAYALLDRASSLSGDPAITLKRDFLSAKISAYYVDQANRYLEKPSGSGVGVGWLYLREAQRYGITNLNSLKDQMAHYSSLYQRRARLSVGIMLRDQTSRRDSPGFDDQLADAIANGLESSGVSVEVVRKSSDVTDALQPNFMLVGEVLEHRVVKKTNLETPQSKYRAGTHETKNPAWLQAKSEYESAQQQLAAAQHALADAQTQRKKKDFVAATNDAVADAQKYADELRNHMEATEKNRLEAIVEPYHFTKKTIELGASIELTFRVNDRLGNVIGQAVDVRNNDHKTAVVLQDVKPEDTEGITNQGVEPNEVQFLTDLEIEARNAMVKAVLEKASELPAKVLQEARTHSQYGDLDGAAEQYIIYLNSTPETSSPERDEAAKFLHDRFNLPAPVASKL